VDTGADLNIIKIDSLIDEVIVDIHNQHQLQGINHQLVRTIGSTLLTLDVRKHSRQFEFHVVSSSFPAPQDGIVGKLFLRENQAVIHLGKNEVTLSENPIIVLLARSEIIVPIKVNDLKLEAQQILVHAQSIGEGVSCGNVSNNVNNQQLLVSVINTSENTIPIEILEL